MCYHLLPTPGNAVSITFAVLQGKQPFSETDQVMYTFPFPSLSGPEGPVHQVDKANRFLLPLPTSLKVPGHEADYTRPFWP